LKFIDFELYELYYASHLCRGIEHTSCSFELLKNKVKCSEGYIYTYSIHSVCLRTLSDTRKCMSELAYLLGMFLRSYTYL